MVIMSATTGFPAAIDQQNPNTVQIRDLQYFANQLFVLFSERCQLGSHVSGVAQKGPEDHDTLLFR